jgi:ArsR family transcriptional regulator
MNKLLALSKQEENQILSYLPKDDVLQKLAEFFQNFSDLTRLKIIVCLSISSLCVSDISMMLNLNQTTVSHQMQILKSQDLVSFKRQGKFIFYSLNHLQINDLMLGAIESAIV